MKTSFPQRDATWTLFTALITGLLLLSVSPAEAQNRPRKLSGGESSAIKVPGAKISTYDMVERAWNPRYPGYLRTPEYAQSVRAARAAGKSVEPPEWINSGGDTPVFQVFVPDTYTGDVPYGLIVYLNSVDWADCRYPGWSEVLKKHRLIWIGPDNAGNRQDAYINQALGIDAVALAMEKYNIDPDRVYACGNSGGARISIHNSMMFPEIFKGGFFHVAASYFTDVQKGPNLYTPGFWSRPDPRKVAIARQHGRYVFLTGDRDRNQKEVENVAEAYRKGGFRNVTYLQVPNMGHSAPPAEWFEKGIIAMDAPLKANAKRSYDNGMRMLNGGQLGMAYENLQKAAAHGLGEEWHAEAEEKFKELTTQRQEAITTLNTQIENGELDEAFRGLGELRRVWGRAVADEAREIGENLAEARIKARSEK